MPIRREIAQSQSETGMRNREAWGVRGQYVEGGSERRTRLPNARRSNDPVIAAEALMNNAG